MDNIEETNINLQKWPLSYRPSSGNGQWEVNFFATTLIIQILGERELHIGSYNVTFTSYLFNYLYETHLAMNSATMFYANNRPSLISLVGLDLLHARVKWQECIQSESNLWKFSYIDLHAQEFSCSEMVPTSPFPHHCKYLFGISWAGLHGWFISINWLQWRRNWTC